MSLSPALTQAVRDDPEDDAPRLVLADWLTDRGDPAGASRADFIRVQCRLARLPEGHPARAELLAAQKRLWRDHSADWGLPDQVPRHRVRFRDAAEEYVPHWSGGRPSRNVWVFSRGFPILLVALKDA